VVRAALFLGVFFAERFLTVAFFTPTFLLDTVPFFDVLPDFFFEGFFFEEPFVFAGFVADFFPDFFADFLPDLLVAFLAAVFFLEARLEGARDAFDLRDGFAAVDFFLLVFFLLLAAAFLAGMRIASKTVQMKSAIIHALPASGSLPSPR